MHYVQVMPLRLLIENKLNIPALPGTGLIAFRVWKTHKRTIDPKMGADLKGVFIVIIESGRSPFMLRPCQPHVYLIISGAMYTIVLAGEVATYATGSYLFNVFLDVVSTLPTSPFRIHTDNNNK